MTTQRLKEESHDKRMRFETATARLRWTRAPRNRVDALLGNHQEKRREEETKETKNVEGRNTSCKKKLAPPYNENSLEKRTSLHPSTRLGLVFMSPALLSM